MRVGWIVLVIGLGATAVGGQAFHEARVAAAKQDIAYTQLVEEMPGFGWYTVQGASWSMIDAVPLRGLTGKTLPDVYARAHVTGTPPYGDEPTRLLVHITDQALADRMLDILTRPRDEVEMYAEDPKLLEEHPIEGMLEAGFTIDRTDLKGVRATLGDRLADDYLIIAQGRKPEGPRRGLAFLALGIALLALSARMLWRRGARAGDEVVEE